MFGLSELATKLLAILATVAGLFTAIKVKEAKDIQRGKDEAEQEDKDQLLEDIALKNEIEEEVNEDIANDSRDERINRLLGKSD